MRSDLKTNKRGQVSLRDAETADSLHEDLEKVLAILNAWLMALPTSTREWKKLDTVFGRIHELYYR